MQSEQGRSIKEKDHPKRSKESAARLAELQAAQSRMKPGDQPRQDGPAEPRTRKPR